MNIRIYLEVGRKDFFKEECVEILLKVKIMSRKISDKWQQISKVYNIQFYKLLEGWKLKINLTWYFSGMVSKFISRLAY